MMDRDDIRSQYVVKDTQYEGTFDFGDKEACLFLADTKTGVFCEVGIPFPYSAALSKNAIDRVVNSFIIALQSVGTGIAVDLLENTGETQ